MTDKFLQDFHSISRKRLIGKFLQANNLNNIICEVGVRSGKNFIKLLRRARPTLIYGVDIWKEDVKTSCNDILLEQKIQTQFYNNLKKLEYQNHRVKIIRDYSINAAKLFPDNFFDFIYIDADHTYEAVKEDINAWWPKIKVNGILSGHDYIEKVLNYKKRENITFGVIKAVNEFRKEKNIQHFHVIQQRYPSWLCLKEN